MPKPLCASHIKPWADRTTDAERLDVFNGPMLTSHLNTGFNHGFFTVADDREVLVSERLAADDLARPGLSPPLQVTWHADAHRSHLAFLREVLFR